jgi:hypothetical protein
MTEPNEPRPWTLKIVSHFTRSSSSSSWRSHKKHVRMDVQTDVSHVVKMLASNKADDLTNRAFGIISRHASKSVGANLRVPCQLRHMVQCCTLCISRKRVLVFYCSSASIHNKFTFRDQIAQGAVGINSSRCHSIRSSTILRYLNSIILSCTIFRLRCCINGRQVNPGS